MRRLALAALLISGCFNPDDIVPIVGSLENGVPGQRVELLRATIGSSCDEAAPFKETSIDDDGRFFFEVFRAQSRSLTTGIGNCLRVKTTFASGTVVYCDIDDVQLGVKVDRFVDWQTELTSDGGAWHFSPGLRLPPETAGTPHLAYQLSLRLDDGGVSWRASDAYYASGLAMPRDIRDDAIAWGEFGGTLVLAGQYANLDPSLFDQTRMTYGGYTVTALPILELRLDGGVVPPSRGASCDEIATPCPLTDGRLETVELKRPSFTLKFASPTPVKRAVLRGFSGLAFSVKVQGVLEDGGLVDLADTAISFPVFLQTQRPVRPSSSLARLEDSPRYELIDLDGGAPVTAVTFTSGAWWQFMDEVSVY